MQISSINSINSINNFKANQNSYTNMDYDIDKEYDFDAFEEKQNLDKSKKSNTAPLNFFLTTIALTAASYFATKKASFLTIKGLEGKFPLFNALDKLAVKINSKLDDIKTKFPAIEVNDMKSFVKNSANKITCWVNDFGKKGLSEEEISSYKKMCKTDDIAPLEIKNAIRKVLASGFGLGATTATVVTRNKDEDNNGIPDKAEKKSNTAKETIEAIPTIATAIANIV